MKEILKLQNISLSVNEKKINDLNLIVKNGDFFVINGKCSWKITFIKITLLKNISSNWRYFFVWKKNYPKK